MGETTIRDVAREAEVSVASVSRVLSGTTNVRPALRLRIEQAVARLGYVPHAGAQMLSRTAATQTIGVVLPDMHGEFFSELLRGMDEEASARGLQLLLSTMHADMDRAVRALRSMRGRVDGVVVMAPQVDADALLAHLPAGLCAMLISCTASHERRPGVRIDGEAAAGVMTRHLIDLGRRRIVHVAGPADNRDAIDRLRGYEAAMRDAGLAPRVLPGTFRQEAGHAAAEALLDRRDGCDAIFAANDQMAIGAMIRLRDAGLDVPGDIALAGFDDIPLAAVMSPGLSTMRVGTGALGARTIQRLAALIAGERDDAVECCTPTLIVRGSTDPNFTNDPQSGQSRGTRP